MDTKMPIVKKGNTKHIIVCILVCAVLIVVSVSVGYLLGTSQATPQNTSQETSQETESTGYAANPAYEYLVGAAAWQTSAEAHALMMQGFYIAEKNVDEMAELADHEQNGYHWVEVDGEKKLYLDGKRVCVVCDIDDTLVDGVHYTANILGKNGEWTNKAFTDFVQSVGCTALPGAVEFANHCKENGVAIFYVTNRYDQAYKVTEEGYAGQEGYQKADGTVIGSSTFDVFGKTMYDITMESMALLGFPTNDPNAANYWEDALLLVNDTKLNGSSKEWIRDTIEEGGTLNTGERTHESTAYPGTVDISSHHISMLLGDDLNDISQIFSDCKNAVDRVALTIENIENWGSRLIVFPNAVYGSAANFASLYGYKALFELFDYTNKDGGAWDLYD